MKRTKKMLALLAAVVLALPLLCATALADDAATGHTFVVEQQETGYEYKLYQIFVGTASVNSNGKYVLSDIKWGNGVKSDTQARVCTMMKVNKDDKDAAAQVAKYVADNQSNDVFHTILTHLGSNDGSSLQYPTTMARGTYTVDNKSVTGYGATGLADGYYLVRNTGIPSAAGTTATYSDYIVEVVGGDVKAAPKAAVPGSQKKVQDVNESVSATLTGLQDSADYDIGDTIPYTLTATLPTNYSNFKSVGYRLIFVDDICKGLTWDGTATIYYGAADTTGTAIKFNDRTGEEIKTHEGSIKVTSSYTDGKVFAYDIDNLMTTPAAKNLIGGDVITIKYNAVLNTNANVGDYGNPNKYHIYYSNNPTVKDSVGETPEDVNIVFTYKAVFEKVDEHSNALTGADFKLEKFIAESNGTEEITVDNVNGTIKGRWQDVTSLHSGSGAVNPVKTGDSTGSTFAFTGLDDGVYRLTETKTPTGYNSIDPIQFTVDAAHDENSNDPKLTDLRGDDGAELTFTKDLSQASLTANIVNQPGLVLPSTGGAGTTMLYVVGSVLVVGSVVALVVKRRSRVE